LRSTELHQRLTRPCVPACPRECVRRREAAFFPHKTR
jgi:hypothetical protein